ncbi:MAG: hypothetical protein MJ072_04235, partial [Clostridia bacterium]|nr:hypothetical protein [Clostridia bacterium]
YSCTYSEPEVPARSTWKKEARLEVVKIKISTELGESEFPVTRLYHKDGKEEKRPFFVFIHFGSAFPDRYYTFEPIWERGYDILTFNYEDVSAENGDFTSGIAKCFYKDGVKKDGDGGKIALWSFAAQRVMDYALTLKECDEKNSAVVGHSRLGKTALLTAAQDERFAFCFSNDSGANGASLSRGNACLKNDVSVTKSESIKEGTALFPYWYENKYPRFGDTNAPDGFDQHYLLSCIAPRRVYVASASEDYWADPRSEFMSCVAASRMWENMGLTGLVCDEEPQIGKAYPEGNVGYHIREGKHFFAQFDWMKYCDYMDLHKNV